MVMVTSLDGDGDGDGDDDANDCAGG